MPRLRVHIENPSDGGFGYWLVKLYLFACLGCLSLLVHVCGAVYVYFARSVPELPDLRTYADQAPGVTTFHAWDGTLLAELAREYREVVPLSRVPRALLDAFIATEDRRFFEHSGLDLRGFLRALQKNVRAGQVLQGGSTITQQVAKAFLSPERTFSRKIREAILARRLEARYSKREILSLYLNHIFLGHGAYGVQAAARRYFDRNVWELGLGELALIAGLAKAPSRFSPIDHPEAAQKRRDQVLRNMVEAGFLTEEQVRPLLGQPVQLRERRDRSRDISPYFVEHVRRELIKQLGQKELYERGYRVETTVLTTADLQAADSVDHIARKLDKRQGWRGREVNLQGSERQLFLERASEKYDGAPLLEETLYLGLVEQVRSDGAIVRIGSRRLPLPLRNMAWAARYSARDATNDRTISSATEALRVGDVIWVRLEHRSYVPRFSEFTYDETGEVVWLPEQRNPPPAAPVLALEQSPRPQAAIFAFDLHNGYVVAMAGGTDFDRSEFNRAVQACRQPGSAYKPIYYSLALDRGYSYETLWNDKIKPEVDPVTGEMWVPQNIDGSYGQQVTLEKALVWSKNPPSVEIYKTVTSREVTARDAIDIVTWARMLGMTTPIHADDALALGASCVRIDELSRAFAVFARNGRPVENIYVRRVLDRRGNVVLDRSAWDDPMLDGASRLDRIVAVAGEYRKPVISPRTAWLTGTLLRRVVSQGHSGPIRATRLIAAGKTGTSSRTSDVWFVGYTSRWLATAWVGDDHYERQLGYKDASFTLSVPMWARFMYATSRDMPLEELPVERPPGVKPNDRGGPLRPGYPPPPEPGVRPDGKPYELPRQLQGLPVVLTGRAPDAAARTPAPAAGRRPKTAR